MRHLKWFRFLWTKVVEEMFPKMWFPHLAAHGVWLHNLLITCSSALRHYSFGIQDPLSMFPKRSFSLSLNVSPFSLFLLPKAPLFFRWGPSPLPGKKNYIHVERPRPNFPTFSAVATCLAFFSYSGKSSWRRNNIFLFPKSRIHVCHVPIHFHYSTFLPKISKGFLNNCYLNSSNFYFLLD